MFFIIIFIKNLRAEKRNNPISGVIALADIWDKFY